MKRQPHEPDQKLGKDLKTFEAQPAATKDLQRLQEQEQRTTGKERAAVDQKIRTQARKKS